MDLEAPDRLGGIATGCRVVPAPAWVRLLSVPVATTIPAMRALAFAAAGAPTIAVIEDHVLVPAGWARQMVAARSDDWAAFLCEYSHLVAPLTAGPPSG